MSDCCASLPGAPGATPSVPLRHEAYFELIISEETADPEEAWKAGSQLPFCEGKSTFIRDIYMRKGACIRKRATTGDHFFIPEAYLPVRATFVSQTFPLLTFL